MRLISACLSLLIYITAVLFLASILRIAVNYLVIIPVIVCSMAFGLAGGVISGTLGLFSNYLFLTLIGLSRYMPENYPVALISGLVLGTTLGFLADHYRSLGREIVRRREIDEQLRNALNERTLLLREVHHRVKNNLNVIHSLIGLQCGYLKDAASVELLNNLSRRIGSMSFVHDQLNDRPYTGTLQLSKYLPSLVEHIMSSYSTRDINLVFRIDNNLPDIILSRATSYGLIINEVLTNAVKHAFAETENPRILITAVSEGDRIILRINDNGHGYNPETVKWGLGFKLIEALTRQLEGEYGYTLISGTEFFLEIPSKTARQ